MALNAARTIDTQANGAKKYQPIFAQPTVPHSLCAYVYLAIFDASRMFVVSASRTTTTTKIMEHCTSARHSF